MSRPTRTLILAGFALPALLRAQASTSTTSACPGAGPGTEVPLGRDSAARRPAARDSAPPPRQIGAGAPDIILRASVSAREVRFASQPHISVRLCGGTLD